MGGERAKMSDRRSKDRIILEILTICIEGENITKIVYTANTNFTTVRAYLDLLIRKGLIIAEDGSPKLYKTTKRGMAMVDRLQMLQEELAAIRQ
jgi:predicted transcriptional regulator